MFSVQSYFPNQPHLTDFGPDARLAGSGCWLLQASGSAAVHPTDPVSFPLQDMDLPAVLLLPLLIVFAAGVYYIYNEVMRFMSKSLVRNKVVVIADAVSGVGTGK